MKLKPKSTVKNPRALVYKRFTGIDISLNQNAVYKTEDDKYWIFDNDKLHFIEMDETSIFIVVNYNTTLKYLNNYFYYIDYAHQWQMDTQNVYPYGIYTTSRRDVRSWTLPLTDTLTNFRISFRAEADCDFGGYIQQNGKQYSFTGHAEKGKLVNVEAVYSQNSASSSNYILLVVRPDDSNATFNLAFSYYLENNNPLSAKFGNIGKYQTNKYYYAGSFDYIIKGSIEGTTAQYLKGNIIPLTSLNIKHFNDSINLSPDDLVVIGDKLFSVENPETVLKQQPKPYRVYFATLNNIL